MRQWYLRITAYADRLLEGLETVEFSDTMKEMQRNWIGKSQGAEMDFAIEDSNEKLRVYTTRPDTIFGVDFMVVAPEHELVNKITTAEQKEAIEKYLAYVKSRSERERMAEVKQITGCFTGAYAINPFDGRANSNLDMQNMFWQVMVPVLSWPCPVAISVILNLQNILIFPSPILSAIILMAKKPIQPKKPF